MVSIKRRVFSSDSHIHGERPPDQFFTKLPHNLAKLALLLNHLQFNFTLMTASSGYNNFWKAFHHKSVTDLMNIREIHVLELGRDWNNFRVSDRRSYLNGRKRNVLITALPSKKVTDEFFRPFSHYCFNSTRNYEKYLH